MPASMSRIVIIVIVLSVVVMLTSRCVSAAFDVGRPPLLQLLPPEDLSLRCVVQRTRRSKRNEAKGRTHPAVSHPLRSWSSSASSELDGSSDGILSSDDDDGDDDDDDRFAVAKRVRFEQRYAQAQPSHRRILERDPRDVTAAAPRVAADSDPDRFVRVVRSSESQRMAAANVLRSMDYAAASIDRMVLGRQWRQRSRAPLYLTPLSAGRSAPPLPESPLACLVQLLLLGVCVRRSLCEELLGCQSLRSLHDAGIVFVESYDDVGDREVPPSNARVQQARGSVQSAADDVVIPYIHVMPIDIDSDDLTDVSLDTILVATDLHPNILSRTTVGCSRSNDDSDDDSANNDASSREDGAVMYIGPDSLALVQHYDYDFDFIESRDDDDDVSIVDLCAGSGIQGLYAAAKARACNIGPTVHVTCVDVNRRSLEMSRLNFQWNRLPEPSFILGDLRKDVGRQVTWDADDDILLGAPHEWRELIVGRPWLVLANPPFLPVPSPSASSTDAAPGLSTTFAIVNCRRYGLFSAGGASGEEILERVVRISSHLGADRLAVVSEFMNPGVDCCARIRRWWSSSSSAVLRADVDADANDLQNAADDGEEVHYKGILFTNERPLPAEEYARRRADPSDPEDLSSWVDHLRAQRIARISPGLLFLRRVHDRGEGLRNNLLRLVHAVVPRSHHGSIWTPTNADAAAFTKARANEFFFNGDDD